MADNDTTMTYGQEIFTISVGASGSFTFSASPTYPQYPDGPNALTGTFNGQEITGFSDYGNPLNGVGLAFANDPDFPEGNPYVGANGILAESGHLDDPAFKNGLSFSVVDGTNVRIYVISDPTASTSASSGYGLAFQTSAGAGGRIYLGYTNTTFTVGCFVRGTSIRLVTGETQVEDLREGDLVLTYSGEARPVKWIGRTIVRPSRASRPAEAMPIRILADAFAPGVPQRDLLVSPGHALLVGDVLINAGELVNGATIVQEEAEIVHYYHVELDSHDILIGNGLPCESYLDDGNRASFLGEAEHVCLHGRIDRANVERTCVPLVVEGPILVAARERLLARAITVGWRVEERPELRIELDGSVLKPIAVPGRATGSSCPGGRRRHCASARRQPSSTASIPPIRMVGSWASRSASCVSTVTYATLPRPASAPASTHARMTAAPPGAGPMAMRPCCWTALPSSSK